MRLGKLTLTGFFNYGNVLQSYGLHTVLSQYANTVETLWYTEDNFLALQWKWGWKENIPGENGAKQFWLGDDSTVKYSSFLSAKYSHAYGLWTFA